MKVFESGLILTENIIFHESITVKGNIISKNGLWSIKAWDIKAWDINVMNINAWDINACDIKAWDINAIDINARDINAWDIKAWDINARDIICETRILKNKTAKTICNIFINNKSNLPIKEQILKKEEKI